MLERMKLYAAKLTSETIDFTQKILERSGLGECTYAPEALLLEPPNDSMAEAKREAEDVVFGAVDEVLAKTGVEVEMIGIVVVNCSIFNAVPSLCAMIVNKYKLRKDVVTYNLSGMGCSASLAAIGLAHQLLQVHENTYALVVSTENITENIYWGNDKPKVPVNCLFRVGGAAVLLSNSPSIRSKSKYQLMRVIRTTTAMSDHAYKCIFQEEDTDGFRGVTINSDLLGCAFKAVELNLTLLGPIILPISHQVRFVLGQIFRKLYGRNVKDVGDDHRNVPNFSQVIDHFFPHVGAKPILDGLRKNLRFNEQDMEASRMTLYRFGNTSSSSIWYALAYAEAKGRIKKGDSVWQFAFGSGFKCNSGIWRAMKDIDDGNALNPWTEEVDQFPVNLDGVGPLEFETLYK